MFAFMQVLNDNFYWITCTPDLIDNRYRIFDNIDTYDDDNDEDKRRLDTFITEDGTLLVPCGVTRIADQIRYYDKKESIKHVKLPSTLEFMNYEAFVNCTNLQEVEIPGSVQYVPQYAFQNCISLKKVYFGKNITLIHSSAFQDCISLQEIDFSDTIQRIGSQAFYNCSSLRAINIPKSVTYIGSSAFSRCTNLECVYFENQSYGYVLSLFQYTKFEDYMYANETNQTECEIKYVPDNDGTGDDDSVDDDGSKISLGLTSIIIIVAVVVVIVIIIIVAVVCVRKHHKKNQQKAQVVTMQRQPQQNDVQVCPPAQTVSVATN